MERRKGKERKSKYMKELRENKRKERGIYMKSTN